MTWDGHKECTLKTLAEDEWVKMHSELLTNGVKHTHTHTPQTLQCKVKMDDAAKMLPELKCRWEMIGHLSGCADPLLWLTEGGLFCFLTKVKWPVFHPSFPCWSVEPKINYALPLCLPTFSLGKKNNEVASGQSYLYSLKSQICLDNLYISHCLSLDPWFE